MKNFAQQILEMKTLGLTYGEWYQKIEKPRLEAIPESVKIANANSHYIGIVDECYACVNCEIKSHNAWKSPCPV
jgi:hypothetical protein